MDIEPLYLDYMNSIQMSTIRFLYEHRLTLHPCVSERDSFILESDQNHFSKQVSKVKNRNRIVNSVDPDETAHYEPSHRDLHCLQYMFGLQG